MAARLQRAERQVDHAFGETPGSAHPQGAGPHRPEGDELSRQQVLVDAAADAFVEQLQRFVVRRELLPQGRRHRQRRVDVAAGAAAGQDDSQAFSSFRRGLARREDAARSLLEIDALA